MRKFSWVLGLAVTALGLAGAPLAQGADFIVPGQNSNGNVTVGSSESHRNLYVGASNITIDSATSGDLYVVGTAVVLTGNVEQDLNAAGSNVTVNGAVGSDARVAGGVVNINAPISGDLLVAGGSVILGEKASIGGDLIVGGGSVTVNGPVSGQVRATGGSLIFNGKVSGPMMVRASRELTFGPKAEVAGNIEFRGPKPAIIASGAKVGTVSYTQWSGRQGARRAVASLFSAVFIFKLIAYIVAVLLALKFLKRPAYLVTNNMYQMPWADLGIGLLVMIVTPIVAILLALTVVGFYVALILGAGLFLAVLIAAIAAAMFSGAVVVKWLMKKPDLVLDWQAALIGTVLLTIIGFIPVIGGLIVAVVILMSLGAIFRLKWQWLRQQGGLPTAL